MPAEQITLDSGEVNIRPTEQQLNTITLELLQTDRNKKRQQLFRVYDNKILSVTIKTRKKTSSTLINLIMLDDTPKRKRGLNTGYFFISAGLFVSAYLVYYLKTHGVSFLASTSAYGLVGLLALSAVLVLGMVLYNMRNSLVFKTRHGRIGLVELFHNNPDKAQYQQFVTQLMERISAIHSRYPVPESRLLPAELGEHRRFRDEGFMTTNQYNIAKSNIFGKHA